MYIVVRRTVFSRRIIASSSDFAMRWCRATQPCFAEPASRYIPAVGTTTRLGSRYRAGECSGLGASLVVRGIKFTVVDLFLFCLLS